MERGEVVLVTEYGGRQIHRRVAADLGRSVVVCSEAEYRQAKKDGRQPDGVGFPREAVEPVTSTSRHQPTFS